jgi:hypothetical protein
MMASKVLSDPKCSDDVGALLKDNILVCPATWFLRSADGQALLAVGISVLCLSLPGDPNPAYARKAGRDDLGPLSKGGGHTPLFTNIKSRLGILRTEVDYKGSQ